MVDKVTVPVQMSQTFKEAIGVYAQTHNMSVANLIRNEIARVIGYNLSQDEVEKGRPRTYANKKERIAAYNEKAKTQRQLAKNILAAVARQQRLRDGAALQAWLDRQETKAHGTTHNQ